MNVELIALLNKYGISQAEIADAANVSRPLVSLVLKGERADRRGITTAALDLIEAAQRQERKTAKRLNELLQAEVA